MIEKLDILNNTTNVFTTDEYVTNVADGTTTINKINEIIDAINKLQGLQTKKQNMLMELPDNINGLANYASFGMMTNIILTIFWWIWTTIHIIHIKRTVPRTSIANQ